MRFFLAIIFLAVVFTSSAQVIPNDLIVTRHARLERPATEKTFLLSALSNNVEHPVFPKAPTPCPTGNFYLAFQLMYDLGDAQTEVNWKADLTVSLYNGTTLLWTQPLSVSTTTQTFVSTVFHSSLVACGDYRLRINNKALTGTVPQSHVILKFILQPFNNEPFNPSATATLSVLQQTEKNQVSANFTIDGTIAYDFEWVYIADYEGFSPTPNQEAVEAFAFKEPARITVGSPVFVHARHYPNGRIWYRARAVGYSPAYPEHRIPGAWSYGANAGVTVTNHQADRTWQTQTMFAEHGKYKKIVTYYDGTLRQRQQQTSLSTSGDTTVVGESMYDFEGRSSVAILAVPAASTSLTYKAAFNTFETSADPVVAANTSTTKRKFHFDNGSLTNTKMATTSGASRYYSPSNDLAAFRKRYTPDAEGYVYSQTEFTNDGTGKVKRQANVGKEFRMEGSHTSKYYYGQATQTELVRLFGSNVGDASHYKKNLLIDNNGQASVSYMDQEGRVIATALTGAKPNNVAELPGYNVNAPIVEDISNKNTMRDGSVVISHKILNTAVNTQFDFNYNLAAKGSNLTLFGCKECKFDLKITVTDPEGRLLAIDIPPIAGNQADDDYSYVRKDLSADDCVNPETALSVQFPVLFVEVGDYTITKILTPKNSTYSEIKTIVEQHASVIAKRQAIEASHVVDASDCEVCTSGCPDTEEIIEEAIADIATQDCENILRNIIKELRAANGNVEPSQTAITGHIRYCEYQVCVQSIDSDIFEKQISRVSTWTEAVGKSLQTLATASNAASYPDPFFRTGGLGASSIATFQNFLSNVFIGTIGTQTYSGNILSVTDPTVLSFYVNSAGQPTPNAQTGNHVLYIDLMTKLKSGEMTQATYDTEINKRRWTYFRAFYINAKRKTKLTISQFATCPGARQSLELIDQLPTTTEGVADYGDDHHATAPISDAELNTYLLVITSSCSNQQITAAHREQITDRLRAYFNRKPKALIKFIVTADLSSDADLIAVQNIMTTYGCGALSKYSETDPFECAEELAVTYKEKPGTGGGQQQLMSAMPSSMSVREKNARATSDSVNNEITRVARNAALKQILENEISTATASSLPIDKSSYEQKSTRTSPGTTKMLTTTTAEYNALMAFYNATGGPNWINKTGWGDINAPNWHGVTQDANGHIISLSLQNNNLVGTIPVGTNGIQNLTYLTGLYLGGNQLTGGIPSQITTMASLKYLGLSSNPLGGTIPTAIGSLINLEFLDLGWCQLTGTIPTGIGSLVNLTYLSLSSNQLTGTLPAGIVNLNKLQQLLFTNNQLTGSIPAQIGNLNKLIILNGSINNLSGSIPPSIRKMTLINQFDFSRNALTGSIPPAIGKMTALSRLSLETNSLTGSIPDSIRYLTNMRFLYLSNNQLSGNIPASIANLVNLEQFHIPSNQLSGPLLSYILGMTKLTSLLAGSNQFTGSIPTAIGNLTTLNVMMLGWNQFSGPIPSELYDLVNLTTLELSGNPLTGTISTDIGQLNKLTYLAMSANQLSGPLPASIGLLNKLTTLNVSGNQLSGTLPNEIGALTEIRMLQLNNNQFSGSIPASIGNLSKATYLAFSTNQFTGPIPSSIGGWSAATQITFSFNDLSGPIPSTIGNLKEVTMFTADGNELDGPLPKEMGRLKKLTYLHLGTNKITGSIPVEFDSLTKLTHFHVQYNRLSGAIPPSIATKIPLIQTYSVNANQYTMSGLLPFKQQYTPALSTFVYYPQDSVDVRDNFVVAVGGSHKLTTQIDRKTSPKSRYRWYQYVNGVSTPLNTSDTSSHTFTLTNIQASDNGKRFYYTITNTDLPNLTLTSRMRKLVVSTDSTKTATICLAFDPNNVTLQKFTISFGWEEIVQKCLDDAAAENQILVNAAMQKVIDIEVTSYLQEQSTKCIAGVNEQFSYSYSKREHHYTLYYYDQAGNLVQTVPPAGVFPSSNGQEPQHKLITRYQYNSLNQVIWQKTPDAGESQFWYNDKGQLRMSQNAQQLKDNNYSFTKYDAQGRIAEVGEITNPTAPLSTLLTSIETIVFPQTSKFTLTDVTKTHYDIADAGISTFTQENVRNRVSWVEILEEGQSAPVVTVYTYDIHGKVKSLLQRIPGLEDKRIDYTYDLISSNVNYVFYQYGKTDQFIHRYTYDADNRLKDVRTSSDGYIWDIDARYRYNLHGRLARLELGHHRVQALDYYYTLQGWIKGVNMPYAADPGGDGTVGTNIRVGRDAFAYTLGYYENDYKPITAGLVLADTRDQIWTRYKSLMGSTNTGLFNGNIAWMITDLEKIGDINNARAKGMQAMLYQYDQLHRIRQTRSLATYTSGAGFSTRTTSPAAYDEDFTYDANGNIMTLQRRDQTGAMLDDFTYDYYDNTNKLQYHDVVTRDITFNGAIPNDNKVYSTITIGNNAYVPASQNVTIRATTAIEFDEAPPSFDLQTGATFHGHIMDETEGEYEYDAVGNLIADHDTGVMITWTPYGKIATVTKGDGTVTTFRYDASGNRVEKKVVTAANVTTIARYVRDASGNILSVYNGQSVSEQAVYGSSRLGMNVVARFVGERKLGGKNFELSNHLGNVLTVITDNIRMNATTSWSQVASVTDYYAFGLSLGGRLWQDGYRYGFQGQEKDGAEEVGGDHYAFKFRTYNPSLGRFLSLDPLAAKYPHNSPYAFSENRVIDGIELEGLEVVLIDPKEKSIYEGGKEFTDEGTIHVTAHGNPTGIRNRSADLSKAAEWISEKGSLEPILKQSSNYHTLRESGKMFIILHSCNPANGENSFAQKVSKEKGRTVVGADSFNHWNSSGQIGPRQNRPKSPEVEGTWLIYKEGVLTRAFDADWDAAGEPSAWDSFWYEKDITYVVNVKQGSNLNLRATPGGKDIGDLPRGTVLNFTGQVDMGWMEVTIGDQKGWVSYDHVEAQYSGKRTENSVEKTSCTIPEL